MKRRDRDCDVTGRAASQACTPTSSSRPGTTSRPFDLRRKSSLYLTYYLHGDTRRHGMALLTSSSATGRPATHRPTMKLLDYMPIVCEFPALPDLAMAGPPGEDAGLEPFAPPQYLTGTKLRA